MIYRYQSVLAPLFLVAALLPIRAQEPPPAVFEEALARLDERIGMLRNEFPALHINEILRGTARATIVNLHAVDPRKAMEQITYAHRKLDRAVFAPVKRAVYQTGATIDQNPTTRFSAARRRQLLLEFADIVKRSGLVLTTYYPGGAAKFGMIRGDSDETYKEIDERYKTISARLKSEVEHDRAAGAGEQGGYGNAGGGSGGGGANWGSDEEEKPLAEGATAKRPRDDDTNPGSSVHSLTAHGIDWVTIFFTGVALIAIGSALAMLLPRLVAASRSLMETGLSKRPMAPVEDPLKLGLAQFQRNKLEKALEHFERVSLETGDRAMTGGFYKALCLVKLGRKAKAVQQVSALSLGTLTHEEVYRLALACEEADMKDSATSLYKEIFARDPSYKDVKRRLAKEDLGGTKG